MYEYMLKWWGECEPFIKEKYGYEQTLYFTSRENRDEVKAKIEKAAKTFGVVFDETEGYFTHKDTVAVVTLEYKGNTYIYEDNFGKDFPSSKIEFIYESGNESCDCSKSRNIKEKCDETFEKMDCGNEITLIDLEIKYQ